MKVRRRNTIKVLAVLFAAIVFSSAARSQSNDANFPTPLTANVVSGTIKARDIGDNRLTTYYFAFNGEQGDIFINVTTKSLDGDIDIFVADAMRPLTRMVIYADTAISETGRLIYLRKPEKLLLRIQGRTPNDDAASFQIKFGGSFVALKGKAAMELDAPTVDSDVTGKVRVNSVGTIIETPEIEKPVAKNEEAVATRSTELEMVPVTPKVKPKKPAKIKPEKVEVAVTEPAKEKKPEVESTETKPQTGRKKPEPKKKGESQPDPLANVRLVVIFKNGDRLERPLTEVLKFSVDKGILTVIAKDGTIRRYSMVDVAKVTIE